MFFERGPPHELITDNDMSFCSKEFKAFVNDLGVNLWFQCVYVPAGNGIAE